MRVCLLLLVTCLVLLVLVDGRSSKESNSKSPRSEGKVTKVRPKQNRHRSSESADSSEEHGRKQKKKNSIRLKIEESFDSRKGSKHNSTRVFGFGFNNKTGKLVSIRNNGTSHELLRFNNTHSTGHSGNQTLIGWRIFARPNMTKTNTFNETKNVFTNIHHNETGVKVVNGSQLHSSVGSNTMTIPPYGWKNINSTDPGWKNINSTDPVQGWKYNPGSVQGWNVEPSAPDLRKEFSVPDQRNDQKYYFGSPALGGYYQKNQNSINENNQPVPYPVIPENRKTISNMAPEHGWGVQPSNTNNEQYGTAFNGNPIHNTYDSSEASSSKVPKGAKKMFKKLAKGVGKVLSSDQVENSMKQAASSYFANPPPQGWIYNPPLDNTKQIFYGRFSKPVGEKSYSADEWRGIIFGNVPRKAETRNLYSAAFPETNQNLNLDVLSAKGRLPDFNQTQYTSFFPKPYYQKIFAGLQNEEINENFRAKRDLSEKGKKMADVINKFFMHERDCNDTELDARRKRHLTIRPIPKNVVSKYREEKRITDFPFSGVEAIVQSDNGVSIYEEEPPEIEIDNNSTKINRTKEEYTKPSVSELIETSLSTTESPGSISPNRTELFPVSETIEQFLNKRPVTRLSVVDETLEKWKSDARKNDTLVTQVTDGTVPNVQTIRIARSHDLTDEADNRHSYHWITRSSESEEVTSYASKVYKKSVQESESIEVKKSNTPRVFSEDSSEHMYNFLSSSSISNSAENMDQDHETTPIMSSDSEEISKKNGYYFFGVYINDYNAKKWENLVSSGESYDPGLERIENTTPAFQTFTDDNHLHSVLMESTVETPVITYQNHDELSTERIPATSEPTIPEPKSDSYVIPEPSGVLLYLPFKIHAISSISYLDHTKEVTRRSTPKDVNDMEKPVTGPSIIRAPIISNRCRKNERMMKGKCRIVW